MIKLHATQKIINEDGNVTVQFTAVTDDDAIISGGLTLVTQVDNIVVGKDYDCNLQEIV